MLINPTKNRILVLKGGFCGKSLLNCNTSWIFLCFLLILAVSLLPLAFSTARFTADSPVFRREFTERSKVFQLSVMNGVIGP